MSLERRRVLRRRELRITMIEGRMARTPRNVARVEALLVRLACALEGL